MFHVVYEGNSDEYVYYMLDNRHLIRGKGIHNNLS